MLTLFRCSTLEDWSDVLYINKFGCHRFGYSDLMNTSSWFCNPKESQPVAFATFYFVTFIIIGALVLLTLFVGVVTTSMENVTNNMDKKKKMNEEADMVASSLLIPPHVLQSYRSAFDLLDLDGGGTVEISELKAVCQHSKSDRRLSNLLKEAEKHGKGELEFSHFLRLMVSLKDK